MPSPFSDWSPDLPPQSTVGGFTIWFTNDTGLESDSLPDLTAAPTASSVESSMHACATTTFGTPVKFTHFSSTNTSPHAPSDQGGHGLEAPTWTAVRDSLRLLSPDALQCNSTALSQDDNKPFSSYFSGDGRADLYHPGPVLDPVDPWPTQDQDRYQRLAEEMQASFDSFGGSAKTYSVEDDKGIDRSTLMKYAVENNQRHEVNSAGLTAVKYAVEND